MLKLFFITGCKLLLIHAVFCQDMHQTMQLAGHYHHQGMHEVAVKYYRRLLFYGNDSLQSVIYPQIAECQLLVGNYDESMFFYSLAANTATSDSLRTEYTFSRVLGSIMSGSYYSALQFLYAVPYESSSYFERKYYFYHGVINMYQSDYNDARENFILSASDQEEAERIDSLFNSVKLHRPDPVIARRLSIFFPGAGQLYAGNLRAAMNSLLLNSGLIVLAIYTAQRYSFIDGTASIIPWLTRYYMGGFRNAETKAIEKRMEKQADLLRKIIDHHQF